MAEVNIERLGKSFGAVSVLKDISLGINDGEFIVLVGPSGCGKSTLLRTIAGLEELTEGEIRIDETVVNDVASKDRNIAMVFQSYALYPHMTVEKNMAFSLRLNKMPQAEIKERISRAADIIGLGSLLDRYPRELSGGQRQRVAMGRALVRDPKVFLFDEPLSNLDAKLRVQMRTEIKELHQRLRTTTIYVTHDQVEAMTMADRIVVMRDGVIEQVGTPLELYDRPGNLFVADFIGSPAMNLFEGEATAEGFRTEIGVLPLPQDSNDARHYGIRPEDFRIGDEGIDATVAVIEPTGPETLVILRTGDRQISIISRDRLDIASGDAVKLSFDRTKVHLFNAEGDRLGRGDMNAKDE